MPDRPLRRSPRIVAAFAVLLCGSAALAAPPDTLWTRTFGGSNIDIAHDVQPTDDGGFIMTGYTRSFGSGGHDLWLLKTDSSGNEEWSWAFGGPDDDEGHAVWPTDDGGYIAVGFTSSFGAGGTDVWLVKTDAEGIEDWTQTFGGANDDEAYAVQETADGDLIIAGVTSSSGAGSRDMWLIKTDAFGTHVWDRTLGGYGSDGAWSVAQTADEGFVLAGWTFSNGPGYLGNAWLVKTDSLGIAEWDEAFGGSDADRGYSARETADGGYIMAGYTGSIGAGLYDLYLVKTDSEGTAEWSEAYGGSGRDYGYSVIQTFDDGFLAAGYTLSFGAGGDDMYLVRTDADGVLQWETTYGGSASDVAHAVTNTTDGGYAIAGHTLSYGAGLHDAYVIRLAPEGASEATAPHVRVVLEAWPNPFTENVTLGFAAPTASNVKLCIHDANGRRVRVIDEMYAPTGTGSVVWNGLDQVGKPVDPGIYFCRLTARNFQMTVKVGCLE